MLLLLAGCNQPVRRPAAESSAPDRVSVFEDFSFDDALEHWTFRTPQLWRIAQEGDRQFLQMAIPPERPMLPGVRRPQEYAIYNQYQFRSFSLSCRVRVDQDTSVARRDAVVIFGRRDDTHFYYAHLSGFTDEWHNALIRVDGDTRVSLVLPNQRPAPTMTDKDWHKVDVLRNADTGLIEVYVDAYEEGARPVFRVTDKTYEWGSVGVGSFDDHASFARVRIEGEARK